MSDQLDERAEILRLARVLHVDAAELTYLAGIPADELRTFRLQVVDALSGRGGILQRIAGAAKLLPGGTAASIAENAFGPLLTARMAKFLEPERLLEMAGGLPDAFLAKVAAELDPRDVGPFLTEVPAARVTAIAEALIAEREYVAMASLAGHLSDEAIAGALAGADARCLLEISLLLEDRTQIERIAALGSEKRVAEMFAAAGPAGLGDEARDLLPYLDDGLRAVGEGALA